MTWLEKLEILKQQLFNSHVAFIQSAWGFGCNKSGSDYKNFAGDHPSITYAQFSEKLTFLTPW